MQACVQMFVLFTNALKQHWCGTWCIHAKSSTLHCCSGYQRVNGYHHTLGNLEAAWET